MYKKALSLLLVLALMMPMVSFNNLEVQAAEAESNLLINPGFEDGKIGWNFVGAPGSGVQTNNPHSGARGFYLDNGDSYAVEQEVTVPYNGTYKASAFISTGGPNSSFGVRKVDGTVLDSVYMPNGANYSSPFALSPIVLKQDDKVIIYSKGGDSWTNGDDFTFEYDPTSVFNNLMNDNGFDQMVRIPKSGPYVLSAMVSGNGDVTITAGEVSQTISGTDTPQEVKLTLPDLASDTKLNISATKGATVTNYSLIFDTDNFENKPPTATNVSISGNYRSGQTLTGNYTFTDEDEGQTEGNSLYQWYSSDTQDGTYTAIDGETKITLVLDDEDAGKYIKFAVTPVDIWEMKGNEVMSAAMDNMVQINYVRNPGFENGKVGWNFVGAPGSGVQTNNPHSGSRGFYLDNGDSYAVEQEVTVPYTGTYKASAFIATGGPNSSFGVRKVDGTVLEKVIISNGANYSSPFTLSPIVLKQNDKVIIYSKGGSSWTNGDDFTFEYDPSSVIHNLMNDSGFDQMVRIPKSGPYVLSAMVSGNGDVTITAGEVSQTIAATDIPQEVKLTLPDLASGTELHISATQGAAVTDYSLIFDTDSIENQPPTAINVSISGIYWSGQTLKGNYTFTDEDQGQIEGNSLYQWYSSDTQDGTYTAIDGETKNTLVLDDEDAGKYFKFAVTPVDMWGMKGNEVMSAATDDRVQINYVRNYSLEIEEKGSPVGWKFANGGLCPNDRSKAKTGFRYGNLPPNSPNSELYYTFTAARTASYDLSMYIKSFAPGTEIGVRYQGDSGAIKSLKTTNATNGYEKVTLTDIPIEKGLKVEVYAKGGDNTAASLIDDIGLFVNEAAGVPDMANLISFKADRQVGDAVINSESRTITFKVPYGTDITSLRVVMRVSEGAEVNPSTTGVDFTNPVQFTISKNDVQNVWTVTCEVKDKKIALKSSNTYLEDAFNWAVNKTEQFVMTGKSGLINKSEFYQGDGPVQYVPSYWAGYYDRTAFYSRDFVHQATGGQIAGLKDENFNMFKIFAQGANESRKWYTLWAYNFNGSNYTLDYHGDSNFVREVPAQFELVQRAYEQYLWTGDKRYVQDETLFNFYTKVMTDFVTLHDSNGNGLAEGTGKGIFDGTSTYNEKAEEKPMESGDSVGSQYQAILAYSGILKARGDDAGAAEWSQKAAEFKKYFNEVWSVKEGNNGYVRVLSTDGTQFTNFGRENSWFMPMKLITEPGKRNDDYMAYIEQKLGTGLGSLPDAPTNIEALTYIPDMYFPYNKADLAWKWMKYIIDVKDLPHERPSQGTNGDYPEVSYTFTSQVIEGMMGIEPNAGEHRVVTAPRLPSGINDVEAKYIPVGEHELDVKHTGLTQTQITNISSKPLTWEARFYGDYNKITVGEQTYEAKHKDINGVRVSYTTITVPANGTLEATASKSDGSGGSNGSGVSGNSGGSTPPDTSANKPADKLKENITLKPSVDSNGNARGIVSDNDVTGVIKNNNARNVHVIVDVPTTAKSVEVVLGKTAVSSLANSDKDLVIYSGIGDVRLNKAILTQLTGKGIVVKIEKAAEVYQKPAITVTIIADGQIVTNFNGVVIVSIPYRKETSEKIENIVVYRIDGNSKVNIPFTKVIDDKVVFATKYSSTFVVDDNPNTYTDITNHWAKDSIDFVAAKELFSGVTSTTFAPNETMTRGMLVTVLGRLDSANIAGKTANFSDVSADKYYAPYIAWANEHAIVSGIGNQRFAPDQAVTREELARIIANYAKYANITLVNTNTAAKSTDEETTSSWALSSVDIMQKSGIITGKPGNKFDAKGKLTRAEAATVINRLIYKIAIGGL